MVKGNTPALPWWPTPRERAGDREPLSQDQIVGAALRLIDREGLDALSMRRLGQELGSGATSLYWHVKNKDQLLDLVVDAVLGEVPLDDDPAAPWRERLVYLCRQLRAALVRHRNVALVLGERMTMGPNALLGLDHLIGILISAGFEGARLAKAFTSILDFVTGFAVLETRTPEGVDRMTPEERQVLVESTFGSLSPDQFPNLRTISAAMACLSADSQFEYGLQRLIDGVEVDLARGGETES